jgi:hypothetical protein
MTRPVIALLLYAFVPFAIPVAHDIGPSKV